MNYEVHLVSSFGGGRTLAIELERHASGWRVTLDGKPLDVDAAEIAPNTLTLLLNGQSFEFTVTPSPGGKLKLQSGVHEFDAEVIDPRAWSGRRHGNVEAEGRQQVVAPMPGKIVRVLVQTGDRVEAGQGLMVVEAMKMQNEIRSPKSGIVERILASAGQPVNAGETLCVIA